MVTLIRNGGWSMWFLLLFGAITLMTAFWFSLRPSKTHMGFIKWMAVAVLFSTLAGTCSCIGTVLFHVAPLEDANLRSRIICEGLAESLSPGILGFSILTLVALLTAVGRRRFDANLTTR